MVKISQDHYQVISSIFHVLAMLRSPPPVTPQKFFLIFLKLAGNYSGKFSAC